MCNHCPYVKAKIDAIKEIHEKFKGRIALIGINSNDPIDYPDDSFDNMKKIAAEKEFGFDYLVDETQHVAKKYGAVCTPDPFLFGKDRKLIFHGKIDNSANPEDTTTEKIAFNLSLSFPRISIIVKGSGDLSNPERRYLIGHNTAPLPFSVA